MVLPGVTALPTHAGAGASSLTADDALWHLLAGNGDERAALAMVAGEHRASGTHAQTHVSAAAAYQHALNEVMTPHAPMMPALAHAQHHHAHQHHHHHHHHQQQHHQTQQHVHLHHDDWAVADGHVGDDAMLLTGLASTTATATHPLAQLHHHHHHQQQQQQHTPQHAHHVFFQQHQHATQHAAQHAHAHECESNGSHSRPFSPTSMLGQHGGAAMHAASMAGLHGHHHVYDEHDSPAGVLRLPAAPAAAGEWTLASPYGPAQIAWAHLVHSAPTPAYHVVSHHAPHEQAQHARASHHDVCGAVADFASEDDSVRAHEPHQRRPLALPQPPPSISVAGGAMAASRAGTLPSIAIVAEAEREVLDAARVTLAHHSPSSLAASSPDSANRSTQAVASGSLSPHGVVHVTPLPSMDNLAPVVASGQRARSKSASRGRSNTRSLSATPEVRGRWTDAEDAQLLRGMSLFPNKWTRIAELVGTRTPQQCLHRWRKSLNPAVQHRRWTEQEDALLRRAVAEHGRAWSRVAEFVPLRTDVQCRERWVNVIDPEIVHGPWTAEEDAALLRAAHVHGAGRWCLIAADMPRRRTDYACRKRHALLTRGDEEVSVVSRGPLRGAHAAVSAKRRAPSSDDGLLDGPGGTSAAAVYEAPSPRTMPSRASKRAAQGAMTRALASGDDDDDDNGSASSNES
jgi:hypothetical protein